MICKLGTTLGLAVAVAFLAGCSQTHDTATALVEERKMALDELGLLLKTLAEEGKKPPAKLAELDAVDAMLPVAGPAIRNGHIVYAWGAGYVSGGKNIIAYEAKTADEGGQVLLQDGTVKKMSADEFKKAEKAK